MTTREILEAEGLGSTFSNMLEYDGTETNNANNIYHFGPDEFILTDGLTQIYVEKAVTYYSSKMADGTEAYHYTCFVCGANWVVLGEATSGCEYDLDLRINRNEWENDEKFLEVVRDLKRRIEQCSKVYLGSGGNAFQEMCYYIHSYRGLGDNILKPDDPV